MSFDEQLEAGLPLTQVPALLPAVAWITGDLSVLRPDCRPDPALLLEPDAGVTPEAQAAGRAQAAEALKAWASRGGPPPPDHPPDDVRRMIEFCLGQPAGPHLDLFREELGLQGDLRAPAWNAAEIAPDRALKVAVIGAGMSGILCAHRLRQAGLDVTILEKNDDVGGTWFENTYPGCRVDVASHFYSYSNAQRHDWPYWFSTQDVLLDYFRECVDTFGLREHIRFGTEVRSATWDERAAEWVVALSTGDEVRVNVLVSAVGQLNRPSFPAIDGRDDFEGVAFHSATWRHDVDLAGKRVAVIGTGASAAQFIPEVAKVAGELTVFQRTPNWLAPTPDYHEPVPDDVHWLFQHLPGYGAWYRFWTFWRNIEGLLPMARVDPSWPGDRNTISEANDQLRELLTMYIAMNFGDRQDMLHQVIPDYPPVAKRIVRDNGIWATTLKSDHVRLVTDDIERITAKGIVTADGTEHVVDVIIYGTGFSASSFLMPMQVTGVGGVDLHEAWNGDARAYLGITIPDFPNLFCLYGPNTNIVINGSIIYFSECESTYVASCLEALLRTGARSLAVKHEVHDAYNERIDAGNKAMAWGAATVNSWYRNANGRVAQNWPFSLTEFWEETRHVDLDDYLVIR